MNLIKKIKIVKNADILQRKMFSIPPIPLLEATGIMPGSINYNFFLAVTIKNGVSR